MKTRVFALVAAVALILGVGHQAKAATVHIEASGTWDGSAATTDFSAAGAAWSVGFDISNPLLTNPTIDFSNFKYLLGGSIVPKTLASIQFFDAFDGGLFQLNFVGGGLVNLFGDTLGGPFGGFSTPAEPAPYKLVIGHYDVAQIFTFDPSGSATGVGTLDVSPTPLPAALPMMLGGLAGLCLLYRRARKKAAFAA